MLHRFYKFWSLVEGWAPFFQKIFPNLVFDDGVGPHCITPWSKVSKRGSVRLRCFNFEGHHFQSHRSHETSFPLWKYLNLSCISSHSLKFFLWFVTSLYVYPLLSYSMNSGLDADAVFLCVYSSYTVSLHGNRNSSLSQITLHMTWVHRHHAIYITARMQW